MDYLEAVVKGKIYARSWNQPQLSHLPVPVQTELYNFTASRGLAQFYLRGGHRSTGGLYLHLRPSFSLSVSQSRYVKIITAEAIRERRGGGERERERKAHSSETPVSTYKTRSCYMPKHHTLKSLFNGDSCNKGITQKRARNTV